jgi:hypothetical protein
MTLFFLMPFSLFYFGIWGLIFLHALNQFFINFLYTKFINLNPFFDRFNRNFYKTFFLSLISLLILLTVNINFYTYKGKLIKIGKDENMSYRALYI